MRTGTFEQVKGLHKQNTNLGFISMFKKKVPENPIEYLMLDEKDFECLVRGGVVHAGNLRIALQDIGFHTMDDAITKADNKIDLYKDHIKQMALKL